MVVVSQFNGTSTPKGSYSAKTGDNDCNVNNFIQVLDSEYNFVLHTMYKYALKQFVLVIDTSDIPM